jgi:hypothetical protein
MELDDLVQVGGDAPLSESVVKADGKIIERRGSIKMTRRAEHQCSSMKLNGLIEIRLGALLLESISKTDSKIIEG